MTAILPIWFLPIIGSALALGFYDLCKKHAVRDNSVMPVLFLATLCGSCVFTAGMFLTGELQSSASCSLYHWNLLLLKALLVSASWICMYYAMRELPISIASPIRASAPLWTFIGSLMLYNEIPTFLQAFGMLSIFAGYYVFSMLGKMEGISFAKHKGIHLAFMGTLLGAGAALYDKYLLGILHIHRNTVQLWFSIDLVFILGAAYLIRRIFFKEGRRFEWRWSIAITGLLLILADWLYFYAVSLPEIKISILSLVRRCNCIITFAVGVYYFKDENIKAKAFALSVILLGIILLAIAG